MTPGETLQFVNQYVVIEVDDPEAEGGRSSAAGYLTEVAHKPDGVWLILDWGFGFLLTDTTTITPETAPT